MSYWAVRIPSLCKCYEHFIFVGEAYVEEYMHWGAFEGLPRDEVGELLEITLDGKQFLYDLSFCDDRLGKLANFGRTYHIFMTCQIFVNSSDICCIREL